jgi:long-subunit fatty acid transport protein
MDVRPLLFSLLAALALPRSSPAQLVVGQYEDEAPLRSWNAFGVPTSVSLALGEARFALVTDSSAALANPALLARLERFTLTLSGGYHTADFHRFGIANTGPVRTEENLRAGFYALEFGGSSIRRRRWSFALAAGLVEDYGRPEVRTSYSSQNTVVYALLWRQTGILRVFNASLAYDFGRGMSAGLGLNIAAGNLERRVREEFPADGIVISDEKSQDLRGWFVNAGLAWRVRDGLLLGLVFRSPSVRKADNRSVLRYEASRAATDIRIDASASDSLRQPWVAGAGFSWEIGRGFRAAADVAFHAWSAYRADFFGEPLARDFRNILRAGGGLEYSASYRLAGRPVRMPVRVGFLLDPQPMKTPRSAYAVLTFGTGLELGRLHLDGAVQIGRESGSGRALKVRRLAISLNYLVEEAR